MPYVSTSERRSYQDHKLWIPPDHTTIARPQGQYNKSHQGRGHCQKLRKGQMGVHSVGGEICCTVLEKKTFSSSAFSTSLVAV